MLRCHSLNTGEGLEANCLNLVSLGPESRAGARGWGLQSSCESLRKGSGEEGQQKSEDMPEVDGEGALQSLGLKFHTVGFQEGWGFREKMA